MQEDLRVKRLVLAPVFGQNWNLSKEFSKSRDIPIKFHYVPFSAGKRCCFKTVVADGLKKSSFSRNCLLSN
jgi:hypothetical protein